MLVRLSYKPPCPGGHNEDRKWHYAAPPRRAMVPARNRRRLNWPVPIARRGRGSAEVDLKATFSYNPHVLADTTKIENGIMPPPPRRAMVPDRNCRQLNCPVPIAHRGGGSAEVAFSYKKTFRIVSTCKVDLNPLNKRIHRTAIALGGMFSQRSWQNSSLIGHRCSCR